MSNFMDIVSENVDGHGSNGNESPRSSAPSPDFSQNSILLSSTDSSINNASLKSSRSDYSQTSNLNNPSSLFVCNKDSLNFHNPFDSGALDLRVSQPKKSFLIENLLKTNGGSSQVKTAQIPVQNQLFTTNLMTKLMRDYWISILNTQNASLGNIQGLQLPFESDLKCGIKRRHSSAESLQQTVFEGSTSSLPILFSEGKPEEEFDDVGSEISSRNMSESFINGNLDMKSRSREKSRELNFNNTRDSSGDTKEPMIFYNPEPENALEIIKTMIENKDVRLKFVNDGMAIKNPFAVDRKDQLTILTKMLCVRMPDGTYKCSGCNRVTEKLRPMQQHLLSHSGSKFNLCTRCLKGFNDKYDMKRHTRKHTYVKPFQCPECNRAFSQRCSLEGHRKKIHQVVFNYAPNQRREIVRVCERCGYACAEIENLLRHLSTEHPGDPCIDRLIKQVQRAKDRKKKSQKLSEEPPIAISNESISNLITSENQPYHAHTTWKLPNFCPNLLQFQDFLKRMAESNTKLTDLKNSTP